MSRRLSFTLAIALMILLSLTLVACEKERPVPTPSRATAAPARGTVTAMPSRSSLTPGAQSSSGTQSAPAAAGTATPTPPAPQPVVVSTSSTTTAGLTFVYSVVAGDTLAKIATRFNTTPEAIVKLNSLTNPDALALGQQLKIPGKAPAAGAGTTSAGGTGTTGASSGTSGASSATGSYVVQAGDTLGKIAARYNTSVDALKRLNGLTNPDVLAIGQKLIVPAASGASAGGATPSATGAQGKSYVVQKGDTLLSIARRFGVTVKQLQTANNITNPDRIFPGQTITIP